MKETLLTGWNAMRWIRLAMGIMCTVQAIQLHDKFLGAIAIILLYQSLANKGCCGANICTTQSSSKQNKSIEEIKFQEIK
jgi:hypothetical protein